MVVGVFGTTISPYLFFWQASEEVEDMRRAPATPALRRDLPAAGPELPASMGHMERHVLFGHHRLFHHSGHRGHTSHRGRHKHRDGGPGRQRAAPHCRRNSPSHLFALGILGVGLIGVPVLAGSAAYALCEAMGWKWGLERKATDARGFYGVIAVSVLAGLVIQYSPISPMKALFWSAVINGVVAVPLMVVIILLVSKKSVMGAYRGSRPILVLGWIATAVMGAAAALMFTT